jgi:glycosyltransferase involved in cell wall biosynthesis
VSFNNSRWLKESIASVLAQTRPVDEIIIADDASTDGSQDLIRAMAAQHPTTIRPILRETNLGVAANRDGAIRMANGDLITTLDADDFYYAEKIEKEVSAIRRAPAGAVAYSDFNMLDPRDAVFCRSDFSLINTSDRRELLQYLLFRKGALPRDMLFPKQLFVDTGGFRHEMRLYEDWDVKLRMARDAACWVYSGVVGIAYRRHGRGLSNVHGLIHGKWRSKVLINNRDWLEPMFGFEVFRNALSNVAYETASLCAQLGELAQAEQICRDVLRIQPDHASVLQLLNRIIHQRKLSGS